MASSRQNGKNYFTTTCSVCYHVFKDPRLLDCYHTFCRDCLEYQIDAAKGNDIFECPLCKEEIGIPKDGAEEIPRNYYIQSDKTPNDKVKCDICGERTKAEYTCVDCKQNYCTFCLKFHSKLQGTKDHKVISVDDKGYRQVIQNVAFCDVHPELELKYFCLSCKILICSDCNMTSHKNHECQNLSDAAGQYTDELTSILSPEEQEAYSKRMKDLKRKNVKHKNSIQDHEDALIESIEKQARNIHKMVDKVKMELMSEVTNELSLRATSAGRSTEDINSRLVSFSALYHFNKLLLQQASNVDIILHGTKIIKRLNFLNKDKQKGDQDADVFDFKPQHLSTEAVKGLFGALNRRDNKMKKVSQFSCTPSDSIVTGIATLPDDRAWCCLGMEGQIQMYNVDGKCLKSLDIGQKIDDIAIGDDCVLYVTCSARKKVLKIQDGREPVTFIRTKACARGISFDNSNNVIVGLTEKDVFYHCSDYPSASLVKVTSDGQQKKIYGKNCMKYPARIATSNNGKIAIADWIDQKVIIADFKGNQLAEFDGPSKGGSSDQGFIPRGICCSTYDDVFVVDAGNDVILQLTLDGQYDETFVSVGQCWSVACDETNKLWVGTQDGKIYVFENSDRASDRSKR